MTGNRKGIDALITALILLVCMLCTVDCKSSIPSSLELLDLSYSFSDYLSDFDKRYNDIEYIPREDIFYNNLANIVKHNSLYYEHINKDLDFKIRNGIPTYAKGLNEFTDLEPFEIFKGFDKKQHSAYSASANLSVSRTLDVSKI